MEQSASRAGRGASLGVAAIILFFAIVALITAHGFPGGSGVFPRFIGWIFVVLAALDVFVQLKAWLSARTTTAFWKNGSVIKEFKAFLWIGFFLLVLYLAGFLAGIPLCLFVFLRFSAGRSWRQCAVLSGAAILFVYLLFVELLEYRLYAGMLFGA